MATVISELECPQCKTLNPHTVDKCTNCGLPRSPESLLRPVPITSKLEIPEDQPVAETRTVDLEPETLQRMLADGSIAILEPQLSSNSQQNEEPEMEPSTTIENPGEGHAVSRLPILIDDEDEELPGVTASAATNTQAAARPTTNSNSAPTPVPLPQVRPSRWRGCLIAFGILAATIIVLGGGFLLWPKGEPTASTSTPVPPSPTARRIEPSPSYPTSIPAPGGAAQTATARSMTATPTATALPPTATRIQPTIAKPQPTEAKPMATKVVPTTQPTVAPTIAILPTPSIAATAAPAPGQNETVPTAAVASETLPPTATLAVATEIALINSTNSLTFTGQLTVPTLLEQIFKPGDVAQVKLLSGDGLIQYFVYNAKGENIAGPQYEVKNIPDGKLEILGNLGETIRLSVIPSGSTPMNIEIVRIPAKSDGNKAAICDEDGCE